MLALDLPTCRRVQLIRQSLDELGGPAMTALVW